MKSQRKQNVEDIKKRIKRISTRGCRLPETVDVAVLAQELKIRLASRSPVVTELRGTRASSRVNYKDMWPSNRVVPMLRINREQDFTETSCVKVQMCRLRKHK
ncbi:uncharacterized protein LOC117339507 [Pecten maximus]|uniref:uncharacterized protein LOC117339507 n=1 Tax=Pecten maximus TaxID=6579 RepID=UPI00145873FA|nr:uncharacterized protein LOC117339507 [Pecten maximus]